MNIFNSLGSNYDLKFALKALFAQNKESYSKQLKDFLEKKYDGRAILAYKGREAIGLALEILNLPKESAIAINGFTCYAVYKAIINEGYDAQILDLPPSADGFDLNFSAETLQKALKQNPKIKVAIIQNTLGYPCDIEKIVKICKEKNIVLIEDLAHCVGTKYEDGKEAGSIGDFVALSFSQDKVIDAVSGGALVIKNKQYNNKTIQQLASPQGGFNNINNLQQLKDHLYPLLTYKIRFLYDFGLGKPLHFILKELNLLSKPMQEGLYDFYSLPNWYCNLAISEFNNLSQQLNHRKKIAKIYEEKLDKKILSKNITDKISLSSNLRFPIFVENRNNLIKHLKSFKIFVSDIWYDEVAPECPNAIEISKRILNLPTHINVTEKDALKISERVNEWLKSQ